MQTIQEGYDVSDHACRFMGYKHKPEIIYYVTGFAKRYPLHTQNLTRFLNFTAS